MSLYNKYRPKIFNDVYGQSEIKQILINILNSNQSIPHTFLFYGPKGTGKTTLARILSKCLNCESGVSSTPCLQCRNCQDIEGGLTTEIHEIDAASNGGVDAIRDIITSASFVSLKLRYKIWIIDEAHMLTIQAWNAFLKTLEEPPPNTIFVLCTTDTKNIPEAAISRCMKLPFMLLDFDNTFSYLKKVCDSENVKYEDSALQVIAKASKGGMRDALTDLEKAILSIGESGAITEQIACLITSSFNYKILSWIAASMIKCDMRTILNLTNGLKNTSTSAATILDSLIDFLHAIWSYQIIQDDSVLSWYTEEQKNDIISLSRCFDNVKLMYTIESLSEAFKILPYNPNPKLFLDISIQKSIGVYFGKTV